jgi:hypothetical protein
MMPVIGFLGPGFRLAGNAQLELQLAFRRGLAETGYVGGAKRGDRIPPG